jgi:hypothetical protein
MLQNLEKYREKYRNSTTAIKEFMSSDSYMNTIKRVVRKYDIPKEKIRDFSYEIALIVVGVNAKENLSKNLENQVNVPSEVAQKIASEIDKSIFSQVKESLEKIQHPKEGVDVATEMPSLSMEIGKSKTAEAVPKKAPSALPIPQTPPSPTGTLIPRTSAPTKNTIADVEAPVTHTASPKPIVGAEEMGMNIPNSVNQQDITSLEPQIEKPASPKTPPNQNYQSENVQGEHLFEKKLREASEAMSTPSTPQKQTGNLPEEITDLATPKPSIPLNQTINDHTSEDTSLQQKKMDPYREMPEEDL